MLVTLCETVAVRGARLTRSSSTPVTVTVCAVLQLSAVKVRESETVATEVSSLASATDTESDGRVSSTIS